MLIDNSEIMVVGTATDISKIAGIKSPYIAKYDEELNFKSKHTFATPSTAIKPKLEQLNDGSQILYFYRAESKDIQTEYSHLLYLDKDYQLSTENKFGRRTRIESLKAYREDFVSYQYEREKLNNSVSLYRDSVSISKKTFALSKETNIPTDLLIKGDSNIYISGIANGFHYRDGHQYLNPKTSGYILKLNQNLVEQNRLVSNIDQNSFINNLTRHEEFILTTGTNQLDSTGMDVTVQCITNELEEIWNFNHHLIDVQKGIKSISQGNKIYTLCETRNKNTKKTNILLVQLDQNGNLENQFTLARDESYYPRDFIVTEDSIYIAANTQASRKSNMKSVLIQLNLEGNLIKESTIKI